MSRFRSSIAKDPIDIQILERMGRAETAILEALDLCDPRKNANTARPKTDEDVIQRRRLLATKRDLEKALSAVHTIRRVGSPYARDPEPTAPSKPLPRIQLPVTASSPVAPKSKE